MNSNLIPCAAEGSCVAMKVEVSGIVVIDVVSGIHSGCCGFASDVLTSEQMMSMSVSPEASLSPLPSVPNIKIKNNVQNTRKHLKAVRIIGTKFRLCMYEEN